jgi:hypothetical protein
MTSTKDENISIISSNSTYIRKNCRKKKYIKSNMKWNKDLSKKERKSSDSFMNTKCIKDREKKRS